MLPCLSTYSVKGRQLQVQRTRRNQDTSGARYSEADSQLDEDDGCVGCIGTRTRRLEHLVMQAAWLVGLDPFGEWGDGVDDLVQHI